MGVEIAFLEGDIYEQLFSGRAEAEPAKIKAQRALDLGDRMMKLQNQVSKACISKELDPIHMLTFRKFEIDNDPLSVAMIESVDLILQSHLALIYRVIPSTRGTSPLHFSDECVNASRTAIERYNTAWEQWMKREDTAWKAVINW